LRKFLDRKYQEAKRTTRASFSSPALVENKSCNHQVEQQLHAVPGDVEAHDQEVLQQPPQSPVVISADPLRPGVDLDSPEAREGKERGAALEEGEQKGLVLAPPGEAMESVTTTEPEKQEVLQG
ncbi:unnamed protein product, partial [Amoebophrya sp. A25]